MLRHIALKVSIIHMLCACNSSTDSIGSPPSQIPIVRALYTEYLDAMERYHSIITPHYKVAHSIFSGESVPNDDYLNFLDSPFRLRSSGCEGITFDELGIIDSYNFCSASYSLEDEQIDYQVNLGKFSTDSKSSSFTKAPKGGLNHYELAIEYSIRGEHSAISLELHYPDNESYWCAITDFHRFSTTSGSAECLLAVQEARAFLESFTEIGAESDFKVR